MRIPKRLWTIWLNDNPELPDLVTKCIATHKLEGYKHELITLDNYGTYGDENDEFPQYFIDCIFSKKWTKAADYLRIYLLYELGGVYLDADASVIPDANFDDLLGNKLFCGFEKNGIISNAIIGAEAGHPLLKEYLRRIDDNFKGSGDLVFEPGVRAFADLIWSRYGGKENFKVYPPDYFYPYSHETGQTTYTANTRTVHHFMKSWK